MRYVCVCACERGKEGDQSKQGTASAKALRPEKDSGEQREGHCGSGMEVCHQSQPFLCAAQ